MREWLLYNNSARVNDAYIYDELNLRNNFCINVYTICVCPTVRSMHTALCIDQRISFMMACVSREIDRIFMPLYFEEFSVYYFRIGKLTDTLSYNGECPSIVMVIHVKLYFGCKFLLTRSKL